jgi:hypothetical protein
MNFFDTYKARLLADGSSVADTFSNSTKHLINETFADSPTYSVITIEDRDVEVRVTDSNEIDEKQLLFRPDSTIHVGAYATIGENKWLILDFDSDRITPKSKIKKADRHLKWLDSKGNLIQEPCAIESVLYEDMRDGKFFFTPQGNLQVYTQYNSNTMNIIAEQRFIFGSSAYRASGIDDFSKVMDGKGYLILNLEKTEKLPKDNFIDNIADNSNVIRSESDTVSGGGDWL